MLPVALPTEYKIGMIVQTKCAWWTYWESMCRIGGAMNIAMDHLATDQVTADVNFRLVHGLS